MPATDQTGVEGATLPITYAIPKLNALLITPILDFFDSLNLGDYCWDSILISLFWVFAIMPMGMERRDGKKSWSS